MFKLLIGITGSVAATRLPDLTRAFLNIGYDIRIVSTSHALYFFDREAPEIRDRLITDDNEWPGSRYQRGDLVLHIELRKWADALLVAPLDANTLAKFAHGICDNCLTCVWRAWDLQKPVFLAPAMNTHMWEHPLTEKHIQAISQFQEATSTSNRRPGIDLPNRSSQNHTKLNWITPITKQLACGDTGLGAMAEVDDIVLQVNKSMKERLAT